MSCLFCFACLVCVTLFVLQSRETFVWPPAHPRCSEPPRMGTNRGAQWTTMWHGRTACSGRTRHRTPPYLTIGRGGRRAERQTIELRVLRAVARCNQLWDPSYIRPSSGICKAPNLRPSASLFSGTVGGTVAVRRRTVDTGHRVPGMVKSPLPRACDAAEGLYHSHDQRVGVSV